MLNRFLFQTILNNSKRSFSVSSSKLSSSNIQEVLDKLNKHKENIEKYKRELDEQIERKAPREQEKLQKLAAAQQDKERGQELMQEQLHKEEKTPLAKAEESIEKLMDKQSVVEDRISDRLWKGHVKLANVAKSKEIESEYDERLEDIKTKTKAKVFALEGEFKDEIKSMSYFERALGLKAAYFKKTTQILEKKEEKIDKELKNKPDYSKYKEEYEKERAQWKEEHKENVRICRQEKQNIKKDMESNLEKASEIAESLLGESGPDYTGGDD